jgi:hypothetical protein
MAAPSHQGSWERVFDVLGCVIEKGRQKRAARVV